MSLLSKYNFFKIANPVLSKVSGFNHVQKKTNELIKKHSIEFLEIGGAVPVNGYLVIHLSPVETYGVPYQRRKGIQYVYDETRDRFEKLDVSLDSAVTLNYNLLAGIPVGMEMIRGINMSHFLEHFTREEGLFLLRECHRILKPGGFLRISCPDLKKFARAYFDADQNFFNQPLIRKYINYQGLSTPGDLFIQKAYDGGNGHKWFYDADSAIQLALDAGFSRGEEKRLHETSLPYKEIVEPAYREVESFYIEVYK